MEGWDSPLRSEREVLQEVLSGSKGLSCAKGEFGFAGSNPVVVVWRGDEAGDDQLSPLAAREGRPVLRGDLWADQGLAVLLRQVQERALSRHHLRQVRCGSDPRGRAP